MAGVRYTSGQEINANPVMMSSLRVLIFLRKFMTSKTYETSKFHVRGTIRCSLSSVDLGCD